MPADDPQTLHVLCSCETNLHDFAYSPQGYVGTPHIRKAMAITSIFTRPGKRSNGYAKTLLQLLLIDIHESRQSSTNDVNDDVFYLFGHSGIGTALYEPFGKDHGASEVVVECLSPIADSILANPSSSPHLDMTLYDYSTLKFAKPTSTSSSRMTFATSWTSWKRKVARDRGRLSPPSQMRTVYIGSSDSSSIP